MWEVATLTYLRGLAGMVDSGAAETLYHGGQSCNEESLTVSNRLDEWWTVWREDLITHKREITQDDRTDSRQRHTLTRYDI